jgi:ATP-binding cassette subfamily B protein
VEITDRTCARALAGDRGDVSLRGVGTTTALVGSTGSGKTALVVYLVTRPTSVHECVDGNDLREITLDSLADSVGLVPQETYLFHSSVRDNLRSRPVGVGPNVE